MRKYKEKIDFVCESETEARDLVEHFRAESVAEGYTLLKNGYVYKSKKAKGEIVDEKWILTIEKQIGGLWDEE